MVVLRAHQMDDFLLGWLFPKGQLALALDGNAYVGPATVIGKIVAEVLQILYASYYFWGNGLLIYLVPTRCHTHCNPIRHLTLCCACASLCALHRRTSTFG